MSTVNVIIDTDILSMFAKVDAMDMLEGLLGRGRVAMTPAIRDEISTPLQYGYTFPNVVLSQIPVVPLTGPAWQAHERLWAIGSPLGKGELEAIAFCAAEGALFVTNDAVARTFAQDQGVHVLSLQAILRALWLSGTHSKIEVQELLERMKKADHFEVPPEVRVEIFDQHESESLDNQDKIKE